MITIKAGIKNKIITPLDNQKIVCDNTDYQIHFTFDAEWDGYPVKTARFTYTKENEQKMIDVIFEGDTCNIPILSNVDTVKIGVFAGDLHTTTPLIIGCKKSILGEEGTPDEPPEDVYGQIIEKCNEAVSKAQSVEYRANKGEFKGDKGDRGYNGVDGKDGKDYVLTDKDKQDIANLIAEHIETALDVIISLQEDFIGGGSE